MPTLKLNRRDHYYAVILSYKGEFFGGVHGPDFREAVSNLIASGRTQVVLDLSEATVMDSSGVGVLIECVTQLRAVGGDMHLAGLERRMRDLFLMTRLLGNVFETYPDAEAAAQSYRETVTA